MNNHINIEFENWLKEIVENKHLHNFETVFHYFKNHFDHFNIFQFDLKENQLSFASLINYLRYHLYIQPYLSEHYCNATTDHEGNLCLDLHCTNSNGVNLLLVFQQDGLVRFISMDNDKNEKDKHIYLIQGTFSNNDNLKQSYKIKRILNLLILNE